MHKAKNMTYAIAHQIALAHLEGGKLDVALKCVAASLFLSSLTRFPRFHDRIAKSYRQKKYDDVLADILLRMFEAAKGVQDWNAAVKAGLELMAPGTYLPLPHLIQSLMQALRRVAYRCCDEGEGREGRAGDLAGTSQLEQESRAEADSLMSRRSRPPASTLPPSLST